MMISRISVERAPGSGLLKSGAEVTTGASVLRSGVSAMREKTIPEGRLGPNVRRTRLVYRTRRHPNPLSPGRLFDPEGEGTRVYISPSALIIPPNARYVHRANRPNHHQSPGGVRRLMDVRRPNFPQRRPHLSPLEKPQSH